MKKLIITIFFMALFSSLLEFIFPWWTLAIPCFAFGLIARLENAKSFLAGFCAIAISWGLMILIKDFPNHHVLSTKLSNLFPLGGNYLSFIVVCIFIGALVGGLSALSASVLRGRR